MRGFVQTSIGRYEEKALDAGCGQGTALAFLRDTCAAVGSDVSLPMLGPAATRGPVVVQEPFALPFRPASFDAAFAFCVYHHVDATEHVRHLRELSRVVRTGVCNSDTHNRHTGIS